MTISVGDSLPAATLLAIGEQGPATVDLAPRLKGRKVVIFGLPGAFTPTCDSAHVPSFIRVRDQLTQKGVDEVICVSVNDPFVMKAWSDSSGAEQGGITMLADASGDFTREIGLEFDAPPAGFYGRSQRYAMLVEDGVVKVLNTEVERGVCELSGGEAMLDAL